MPSKRSGRSVRGITRTSPRRPCGRTISPMATSFSLLNDLENRPLPQLGRVGVEDRADRPSGPPLLADDLAEIGLRDPQLDHRQDRKSTRLNSSHVSISYAVFCLKKKKKNISHSTP